MEKFLYTFVFIMVALWALGYFVYSVGSTIHLLLLVAVIAILLRVINGREEV